ncbi:MAG: VWA domain-containing protein [Bacteroidetes bacterium]|nr:VWA domain-containing protein [Bacteroidota bacterium]
MLRFQHISHLFALAAIPVFVVLFIWLIYWRKSKIKKLGDIDLVSEQIRGVIAGRITLKFILLCVAFLLLAIGWANLQTGDKTEKVQRKGVDVMIALDLSKSMLARDVEPDRLTKAKQFIMRMTDKMQNDRAGLIVFAGRAYLQVPLTIDYSALKMMLNNVNTGLIPTQGTVIGDAIDMAMQSFSQKERKYKSLVIISDGEDHDEQALAKAKEAAEAGVTIHTIGIGSPQGTTLYDPDTKSVKLDENGAPVVSKLNEDELKSLAATGHGTYTLLRNTDDAAEKLVDAMAGMEQKSLGSVVFTDFTSYFQYFLAAAFVLLAAEWFLPGAKLKMKTETA